MQYSKRLAPLQSYEVSPCDFRTSFTNIHALYAEDDDEPVSVVLSSQQSLTMTSSMTVEYNSTTFMYVAFMNSTDSFITKVMMNR